MSHRLMLTSNRTMIASRHYLASFFQLPSAHNSPTNQDALKEKKSKENQGQEDNLPAALLAG